MAKVGRKTLLNKALLGKIKELVIDGKSLVDIAKICNIVESTLYEWSSDNYLRLNDKVEGWKRDRKLMLAEKNIEAILDMGVNDKDSLKVVADTSKFVTETLGRDNYSKRSEFTGKDGKDLMPQPLLNGQSNVQDNTSDNKTTQTQEEA